MQLSVSDYTIALKTLGWYDSNFEFAASVSYSFSWMVTKDKKHYKQAKKVLKLSVKHGNIQAKKS